MLEKLALLKIAACSAPALTKVSSACLASAGSTPTLTAPTSVGFFTRGPVTSLHLRFHGRFGDAPATCNFLAQRNCRQKRGFREARVWRSGVARRSRTPRRLSQEAFATAME